jgi:hypothetical protein
MKKLLSVFVVALFIFSCGPSNNPVLLKKIDDLSSASSEQSFTVSGKFIQPMSFEVGQWATYINKNGDEKTISKTSIVGQEEGGWVLETYNLTGKEENTAQICVVGIDKVKSEEDFDKIEIMWVKFIENGEVQTLSGPILSLMKGFYKKGLKGLVAQTEGLLDGGTVRVPAGIFNGCSKVRTEVSFLGSKTVADSYYHSDVPISGMVKSVTDDGKSNMELLEFGKSGAKKSF